MRSSAGMPRGVNGDLAENLFDFVRVHVYFARRMSAEADFTLCKCALQPLFYYCFEGF